jgi:hypothetical protein
LPAFFYASGKKSRSFATQSRAPLRGCGRRDRCMRTNIPPTSLLNGALGSRAGCRRVSMVASVKGLAPKDSRTGFAPTGAGCRDLVGANPVRESFGAVTSQSPYCSWWSSFSGQQWACAGMTIKSEERGTHVPHRTGAIGADTFAQAPRKTGPIPPGPHETHRPIGLSRSADTQ